METKYTWLILILLIIVCIFLVITRKKNVEHLTFDEVLDNKCSTGGVLHDYDWGTKKCVKSETQCNSEPVTCYDNDGGSYNAYKVQDVRDEDEDNDYCKAPDDCNTSTCSPTTCDTISCGYDGLCSKVTSVNPPGKCKNQCPTYDDCSGDSFKWKIHDRKWKKYETKQNYNKDGECVSKYLNGSQWEEISEDFKDDYLQCTFNNITLNDTQFKKSNDQIVCTNNESNVWNIIGFNKEDGEFNNRLEGDGGQLDLNHNLYGTCTLNNITEDDYEIYCVPPEPVQSDTYTPLDCYTEDGKMIYEKDGATDELKYIQENYLYTHTQSTCYNKCQSFDTASSSSPYNPSYTYMTDDCPNIDTLCAAACLQDAAGPYHEVVSGVQCHCKNFTVVTATTSNCYKLEDYENYDERVCISNNNLFEYSDETCTNKPIICFDPLGNTTPGFTQLEGACYELSDGPQDKYFRYTLGRDAGGNEGETWGETPASMIRDASCAPQIPNTPTITISEVGKTHNSITVSVTMPVGNTDAVYPYTRLMYKNVLSEELFPQLASKYHALHTTNATNTIYGTPNEGYIDVVGQNTITFENLLPDTQYTFQIVTVYDEDGNSNVYSDPLEIATSIAPTQPETCEYSIDNGKQFKGSSLIFYEGKTVEECKTLCNDVPECIGFNKSSTPTDSTCYLKTDDQPEPSSSYFSTTRRRTQWYDSTKKAYKKIYTIDGSCEPPQQEPAAALAPTILGLTITDDFEPRINVKFDLQLANDDAHALSYWVMVDSIENGWVYAQQVAAGLYARQSNVYYKDTGLDIPGLEPGKTYSVHIYKVDEDWDGNLWVGGEILDNLPTFKESSSLSIYVPSSLGVPRIETATINPDNNVITFEIDWDTQEDSNYEHEFSMSYQLRYRKLWDDDNVVSGGETEAITTTRIHTDEVSIEPLTAPPTNTFTFDAPIIPNGTTGKLPMGTNWEFWAVKVIDDNVQAESNKMTVFIGSVNGKACNSRRANIAIPNVHPCTSQQCVYESKWIGFRLVTEYRCRTDAASPPSPTLSSATINPDNNYITIVMDLNTQEDSYYDIDDYDVKYRSIEKDETNSKTLTPMEVGVVSAMGKLMMVDPRPTSWPDGEVEFWLVKRSGLTEKAESSKHRISIGAMNGRSCLYHVNCTSRDCAGGVGWLRPGTCRSHSY